MTRLPISMPLLLPNLPNHYTVQHTTKILVSLLCVIVQSVCMSSGKVVKTVRLQETYDFGQMEHAAGVKS